MSNSVETMIAFTLHECWLDDDRAPEECYRYLDIPMLDWCHTQFGPKDEAWRLECRFPHAVNLHHGLYAVDAIILFHHAEDAVMFTMRFPEIPRR